MVKTFFGSLALTTVCAGTVRHPRSAPPEPNPTNPSQSKDGFSRLDHPTAMICDYKRMLFTDISNYVNLTVNLNNLTVNLPSHVVWTFRRRASQCFSVLRHASPCFVVLRGIRQTASTGGILNYGNLLLN